MSATAPLKAEVVSVSYAVADHQNLANSDHLRRIASSIVGKLVQLGRKLRVALHLACKSCSTGRFASPIFEAL